MEQQLNLFNFPESAEETYGIKARKLLELAKGAGCKCPLCDQFIKVYRRPITGAMCVALIKIYQAYNRYKWQPGDETKSIHVEGLLKRCDVSSSIRGDAPKLRFWGLIEKVESVREDGSKRNGHYRLTKDGRFFVMNIFAVKKYAIIYNDKFYGFEGEYVSMKDCLEGKFEYDKLMEASDADGI